MTTTEDTDRLVRDLAARAGEYGLRLRPTLAVAAAAGAALALTASLSLLTTGSGLAEAVQHRWLYQKLVCMAAVAAGVWPLVEDLAVPERRPLRAGRLLAAIALLAAGALVDHGGVGIAGHGPLSIPACLTAIVLLSLPVLALLLAALRHAAAPTQPAMAGAAAGLLAGALGAMAYALACRNDGGTFVLVWYGAALATVAALGASAGRPALAW